ncbi:MAG: DUF2934 domain-containing protein [Pseudomonadota bacterium]
MNNKKKNEAKNNLTELTNKQETKSQPTREQIAERAYKLFEQRGYTHGTDMNDWLQAEKELSQK